MLDSRKGVSHSYPQLGNKPLKETFEELLQLPVFVEHDTRTMALGEQWFGHAKDYSNVSLFKYRFRYRIEYDS
ncbi:MAG: ROK family protein, partial [Chloroflexia bacterium]|nr:ROK family protein [Chloroflexia bacterium]